MRSANRQTSNAQKVLHRFLKNIPAVIGGIILLAVVLVAVFSTFLMPNDPNKLHPELRMAAPSRTYPLGNDQLGRCILSRLIAGTSTTLGNAMAVLAGILIIGVPLGVIAGYKGGMIDGITMRMVDIVCTFPSSLVGLAVVGILGPGLQNIMLVLVSLWWAPLARMVRGEVLQIREKGYITAAKANGLSDAEIIFRHVILNVMSPVVAYESKAYSESVRAELSDTTLLAAWKDVFSDTLPACEDKMLKTVDVGTDPGFFLIVLGQMGYPCIGAGLYVSHPVK